MRLSTDAWGLLLAEAYSKKAACSRSMVGAVILDDDHEFVAGGFNGTPRKTLECIHGGCPRGMLTYEQIAEHADYDRGPGRCTAVHAEMNALLRAGKSARGATMYVTREPCPGCAKHVRAAGIRRVVWPGGEIDYAMEGS